ncbi:MAG: hypothetical protein QXK12_07935 [Candidatus Nezhaarchaeales archaeon]
MSSEEAKILAELKKSLEDKVVQLQRELDLTKQLVKLVDESLTKLSFKPAVELTATEEKPLERTAEPKVLITSRDRKTLGAMYIGEDYVRIEPSPEYQFDVNTSPFKQFFIDRVLEDMKNKDRKAAESGALSPDKVMDYQITTDGNILKEILVKNVTDERRIRELRSSIRWTLERMLEKMKTSKT